MSNLLEIKGLVKRYPNFELNIDLVLPAGYVMGFVGANGAGKTTTIHSVLGLVTPDGGQISCIDKQDIGVVYDNPGMPKTWRCSRIAKAISGFYENWDQNLFANLVNRLGINMRSKFMQLSRGTVMKFQLALALAHHPRLLLLDEPTSGLDPLARDHFLDLLSAFMEHAGNSALFSTHITSDLRNIADYMTVIDNGHIAHSSVTEDLVDSYRLIRGRSAQLSSDLKGQLLGARFNETNFEALIPSNLVTSLPPDWAVDEPSLDQLVVHLCTHDSTGSIAGDLNV